MSASTAAVNEKKSIEILDRKVSYTFLVDATRTMSKSSEEQIERMIKKGFIVGEILESDDDTDYTHRGWWQILKA